MPIPLNAATEIVRAYLTKKLQYLTDDSIPVNLGPRRKSDIDFIARRPSDDAAKIVNIFNKEISLSPKLIIEVKGWLDYSQEANLRWFEAHLAVMKNSLYLSDHMVARLANQGALSILTKQIFEFAQERFHGSNFQRVLIFPLNKLEAEATYKDRLNHVLKAFIKKNVVLLDIVKMTNDLVQLLKVKEDEHIDPRRNFVLELLYFLEYARRNAVNS